MSTEHVLERRSKLLAERVSHLRESLAEALRAPNDRPLFTKQLTEREALAWWREHRYDDLGRRALASMGMEERLELDVWLTQAREAELVTDE